MTEEEARDWIASRFDGAALARLERLANIVRVESERQNLIARSTLDAIWARHIVDSLQLITMALPGRWLDIGTGAGFPGLAVAAVQADREMILVEPRRLRADFLQSAANELGLPQVTVVPSKVEAVDRPVAVISARAVANVATVLKSASQCSSLETIWLLPKGRSAAEEVAVARRTWHGMFHVEQSITSLESSIVVARKVALR